MEQHKSLLAPKILDADKADRYHQSATQAYKTVIREGHCEREGLQQTSRREQLRSEAWEWRMEAEQAKESSNQKTKTKIRRRMLQLRSVAMFS